jgi:hypothetical protein
MPLLFKISRFHRGWIRSRCLKTWRKIYPGMWKRIRMDLAALVLIRIHEHGKWKLTKINK